MSTQTQLPYAWIRQIPGSLFNLDEKPLLGFPPPFAWDAMSKQIQEALQLKSFSIQPGEWMWRSRDDLFSGFGKEIKGLSLAVTPLQGLAYWVMPEQEIKQLMGMLLASPETTASSDVEEEFTKTFFKFISVEAISAFQKTIADQELSPSLSGESGLPSDDSLCMDIHLHINNEAFFGRLFLSKELKSSWRQRYLAQQPNIAMASPLADSLNVIVHLEAGRVNLNLSDWKKLKTGDFLFLDQCSLKPDEDKGRVSLTINGHPYFRARIKQGNLKILEHPLYHEANTLMEDSNNNDDDLFSDDDLNLDSDEHTESTKDDSSADLTDSDLGLSDSELGLDDEKPASKTEKNEPEAGAVVGAEKVGSTPANVEDVQLPVIVELGRIQISVKKLLELQPGNMLDLDIHPEAGVDLVVHGKRIARGELLRIGEALGVRIQELS